MAKLYVSEFWGQGSDNSGRMSPSPLVPPLAESVTVFSGTSVEVPPLNPNTKLIRLHADGICSVCFSGAAATTAGLRLVAGQTEYFSVKPGVVISVIQNT